MPAPRTAKRTTSKTKARGHSRRHTTTRKARTAKRGVRKWSGKVNETSDALDLKDGLFKGTPTQIAQSLKQSAERSHRRKSSPYRSAMSMLVFYINRAGKNLSATQRKRLEAAKGKLREAFGKPPAA